MNGDQTTRDGRTQQVDSQEASGQERMTDEIVIGTYQRWLEATLGGISGMSSKNVTSTRSWLYAKRAYDIHRCRRIMAWNGLLTDADLPEDAMIPEYLVAVYQHTCIALYHRSVNGSRGLLGVARELAIPEDGPDADRLIRRLTRTAIRAVYALGLDYGLVRIALVARGKLAVRGVEPFPTMPYGIAEKYGAAMVSGIGGTNGDDRLAATVRSLSDEPRSISIASSTEHPDEDEQIVLGLDVEFVLTDSRGELVPAERYLPRSGAAGHDAAIISGRVVRALAELRPAPSANPRQLFAHLQHAMRLAASRITDPALAWRAGASPVAGLYTGGHIHLSGVPLTFELLRVLDNYLALPLSWLEDRRAIARRPVFGWLGHARLKPHGGFEYRTPASWLVSPVVTRGVLALAKLVAVHRDLLRHRPLTQLRMQRAYYEGDQHLSRSFLPSWKRDIMNTSSYGLYATEIDPFIHLLEEGWLWDEEADIRKAWGFVRPTVLSTNISSNNFYR